MSDLLHDTVNTHSELQPSWQNFNDKLQWRHSGHLGITPPVGWQWVFHIEWDRHPLTPPSFCQGVTFSPFKMQQLFPIELLLLPLLLAFNKARGYQRVKEKLPWLCRSPDCTIGAVREALYKGRARGRARWRLAFAPLINQRVLAATA